MEKNEIIKFRRLLNDFYLESVTYGIDKAMNKDYGNDKLINMKEIIMEAFKKRCK